MKVDIMPKEVIVDANPDAMYDYYVLMTRFGYYIVELDPHQVTISRDLEDAKGFSSYQKAKDAEKKDGAYHSFDIRACGVKFIVQTL